MQTAVTPKSKPTILERAQMRALEKYIQAVRNGWPFRAAFWRGVISGLGGLRSN